MVHSRGAVDREMQVQSSAVGRHWPAAGRSTVAGVHGTGANHYALCAREGSRVIWGAGSGAGSRASRWAAGADRPRRRRGPSRCGRYAGCGAEAEMRSTGPPRAVAAAEGRVILARRAGRRPLPAAEPRGIGRVIDPEPPGCPGGSTPRPDAARSPRRRRRFPEASPTWPVWPVPEPSLRWRDHTRRSWGSPHGWFRDPRWCSHADRQAVRRWRASPPPSSVASPSRRRSTGPASPASRSTT